MSDLNPKGALIDLGGEKRNLLFTLNVIDEIQSTKNKTVFEVLQELMDPLKQVKAIKYLMKVLLEDEVARVKYKDPASEIKELSEEEIGWAVTSLNSSEAVQAILSAYGISVPESDDEEDDPKMTGEQQNS